ncbi:MAG TPA: prolyl oligopeptidase family serine peptidase [Opitutaceae bacterium]|nr:prolyl oligopeptidase family serine peptidase [Opitutaceae bacterium]
MGALPLLFSLAAAAAASAASPPASPPDPFQWMEAPEAPRALAWVRAENARSLARLEGDPRYETLHREALAVVTASDRIPYPSFLRADLLANFWQDSGHVRGLLRTVPISDYRQAAPPWRVLLDVDRLAAAEHANWVYKGLDLRWPDKRRALVRLSDGGRDAYGAREIDLDSGQFVPGGFQLPSSKQDVAWFDPDTLEVARDWGPGSLTTSGYPYIVKLLGRGQALSAAREIFRGTAQDVGVTPVSLDDNATGRHWPALERAVNFFESEVYLVPGGAPQKLNLPPKLNLAGVLAGQLVFTTLQDWAPAAGAPTYPQGSLLSADLDTLRRDPGAPLTVIFRPGPRETIDGVSLSRSHLIVTGYRNVKGFALAFAPLSAGGWARRELALPGNSSIDAVSASDDSDLALFNVRSFLTPASLWLADLGRGRLEVLKSAPARFDASKDLVEQFEAVSSDGTRVPYFVVRPRDFAHDGSHPTLLYGYGGFQISMTPEYSGTIGKLWLERGGTYVLANIRGGGEFGPAWHEAGLKTRRQRIYDDFAAVARDLISRRITSPRRLGIEGGSNGGLLMGVELTQHPELWRAVVIQVPLLDMLRFDQIGAGSSWEAEYGDPHDPVEGAFLRSISPYHHLRAGVSYPEPFFVTSTADDRVGPGHARKMAAKMEAMGLPFLYYENTEGGHAASANLQEAARRVSLEMTYLSQKLMDLMGLSPMAPWRGRVILGHEKDPSSDAPDEQDIRPGRLALRRYDDRPCLGPAPAGGPRAASHPCPGHRALAQAGKSLARAPHPRAPGKRLAPEMRAIRLLALMGALAAGTAALPGQPAAEPGNFDPGARRPARRLAIAPSPRDAQERWTPTDFGAANPRLPTLVVAGDSTASTGDPAHRGWGAVLADYFDPAKINVINRAVGGRSFRTFYGEGLWQKIADALKPGDVVVIEFGHNDGGTPGVSRPDRGDLPGTGEETKAVRHADGTVETVHTFGWYARTFVREARAKGALPVLSSTTPRNIWTNPRASFRDGRLLEQQPGYDAAADRIEYGMGGMLGWIRQVAREEHAPFVDHSGLSGAVFDRLGREATAKYFPADHTHTSTEGAVVNAETMVAGLRTLRLPAIEAGLNGRGRGIAPAPPASSPRG